MKRSQGNNGECEAIIVPLKAIGAALRKVPERLHVPHGTHREDS
jgi:hypothetical protein